MVCIALHCVGERVGGCEGLWHYSVNSWHLGLAGHGLTHTRGEGLLCLFVLVPSFRLISVCLCLCFYVACLSIVQESLSLSLWCNSGCRSFRKEEGGEKREEDSCQSFLIYHRRGGGQRELLYDGMWEKCCCPSVVRGLRAEAGDWMDNIMTTLVYGKGRIERRAPVWFRGGSSLFLSSSLKARHSR